MKDDFHIDMSGRIYKGRTIGIAVVGTKTKVNYGCALKRNLIIKVRNELFKENIYEDSAKLYAICIYYIIREIKENINTLIICNDEDFKVVKNTLKKLLINPNFEIINISEFRNRLGRNIGSLADNYARVYRRRALKPTRLSKGKKLNIIQVNYKTIKECWEKLDKK